jgi:excisionase family DNA binding protein
MLIQAAALRGGISILSEIIQIASGLLMLAPNCKKKEIRADLIYSTSDAAKLLNTARLHIIEFIRSGDLTARRIGDRYHISGRSLLAFLSKESEHVKLSHSRDHNDAQAMI